VLVTNPEKVGKDAGEIVGLPPTGVIATNDIEKVIVLDADCVLFAGIVKDLDMYCRLLRSGKNVISPAGPFFPTVERSQVSTMNGRRGWTPPSSRRSATLSPA